MWEVLNFGSLRKGNTWTSHAACCSSSELELVDTSLRTGFWTCRARKTLKILEVQIIRSLRSLGDIGSVFFLSMTEGSTPRPSSSLSCTNKYFVFTHRRACPRSSTRHPLRSTVALRPKTGGASSRAWPCCPQALTGSATSTVCRQRRCEPAEVRPCRCWGLCGPSRRRRTTRSSGTGRGGRPEGARLRSVRPCAREREAMWRAGVRANDACFGILIVLNPHRLSRWSRGLGFFFALLGLRNNCP